MKKLSLTFLCAALLASATLYAQDAPSQPANNRRGGRGQGMGGPRREPVQGVVTAVTDKSVTVKTEVGEIWTVDVSENTRVTKERQPAKFTDVKSGQAVIAMGMEEPGKKELHAAILAMLSPEQAIAISQRTAKMKENLGKTYIIGKITKIDETKLTVQRPDGVEQPAAVDENTSLRKGGGGGRGMMGEGAAPAAAAAPIEGEPITLADIKVGDNITGPGSVQNGTFLLKELHVLNGRPGGGRRREGAAPAPAPTPAPEQ